MEVVILGNGFDLNHYLPTKYLNFLNTVNFLMSHYNSENMKTVGDVFSSFDLHTIDDGIYESYLTHELIYHATNLNKYDVDTMIDTAKQNSWFGYFLSHLNKNIGWIDFEKEIAEVIEAFRELFDKITPTFGFNSILKNPQSKHICSKFDFYYEESGGFWGGSDEKVKVVKKDYCFEKPFGTKNIMVDKEKICNKLYNDLLDFSNLLKTYLRVFISEPLLTMKNKGAVPYDNLFSEVQKIITFNYTPTVEYLYDLPEKTTVGYVHGTVYSDIVLGVNPDNYDELDDLNTDFIQFKKYYQRVLFDADDTYKHSLLGCNLDNETIELTIMGHSLDITDSDILKEWIERAHYIHIYYHDESAIGGYIRNMVSMFGRQKFESIIKNKNLKFLKISPVRFLKKV